MWSRARCKRMGLGSRCAIGTCGTVLRRRGGRRVLGGFGEGLDRRWWGRCRSVRGLLQCRFLKLSFLCFFFLLFLLFSCPSSSLSSSSQGKSSHGMSYHITSFTPSLFFPFLSFPFLFFSFLLSFPSCLIIPKTKLETNKTNLSKNRVEQTMRAIN